MWLVNKCAVFGAAFIAIAILTSCSECPGEDQNYTCVEVDIPLPPDCSIACQPGA